MVGHDAPRHVLAEVACCAAGHTVADRVLEEYVACIHHLSKHCFRNKGGNSLVEFLVGSFVRVRECIVMRVAIKTFFS
jgi:hypothetical protein